MLTYYSRTYFADDDQVDGETVVLNPQVDLTYRSRVGPSLMIDVQLRKQFWQERLAGSLLIRNLGASEFRYHPIEAAFALTVYLKLELYLSGDAGS